MAWDAPGAGRSEDPPSWWRLGDYADCAAALVAALGLARPHVGGLSFGGALAIELYRRHPEIPRSLVLISAYAGWAGSLPSEVVQDRLARSLALSKMPAAEFARGMLATIFPPGTPPSILDDFASVATDVHPDGFRTMVHALAEADLREVLGVITVPALVIAGAVDTRAPGDVASALQRGIPSARLVSLPNVGHLPTLQAPREVNDLIRQFLREPSVSGSR